MLGFQFLEELLVLIKEHTERRKASPGPYKSYFSPSELEQKISFCLREEGVSEESLLEDAKTYLELSPLTSHKYFLNHLFSNITGASQVGEMLSMFVNTTGALFESSPMATMMEKQLIEKMCNLVGFPSGNGIFLSGGTQANLIGLLTARHAKFQSVKKKGMDQVKPILFTSDQAHYSYFGAANILGVGVENVWIIPTNEKGEMIPSELEKTIQRALQQGNEPFAIGATAGTTILGAFDPLEEVGQIAQKYGLWFHVDGCLGASVVFSPKHKSLLKGIELADSVSWDPHKLLGVSLFCSVLLTKDRDILREVCSSPTNDYLFHTSNSYDLGLLSPQCARKTDAIKLWFNWRYLGTKGLEKRIEKLFELASFCEMIINRSEKLEFVNPRQSLSLFFRLKKLNNSSQEYFRDQLYTKGGAFLNYATCRGKTGLRMMISNPELSKSDLVQLFSSLNFY